MSGDGVEEEKSGSIQLIIPNLRKNGTRKQSNLGSFNMGVRPLSEQERTEKKRLREEAEKEREKAKMIKKEIDEVTTLMMQLEERQSGPTEPRVTTPIIPPLPPPSPPANSLDSDGTELPRTFTIDNAEEEGAIAMEEDFANRMDNVIPVSEYFKQDIFPLDVVVRLMTLSSEIPLDHCEIAIVFKEAWWRKGRFTNTEALGAFIRDRPPQRIDIGPVHPSSDTTESHSRLPLRKHLVFDVDIEDRTETMRNGYVRNCPCRGKSEVCYPGCWFYIQVAVKCLTYLLRKVYDAKHIVPVWSGRRGVHMWVLDREFFEVNEDTRKGIAGRIRLIGSPAKYRHDEHMYYMFENILYPAFRDHFLRGNLLIIHSDTARVILEVVSDATTLEEPDLKREHSNRTLDHIQRIREQTTFKRRSQAWESMCEDLEKFVPFFEWEVVFRLLYPKIDEPVTTAMHHCVKAPFVVHPVTKRCSVPIPDIDTWIPSMAPRISQLVKPPEDPKRPISSYGYPDYGGKKKKSPLDEYVTYLDKVISEAYPFKGYHV